MACLGDREEGRQSLLVYLFSLLSSASQHSISRIQVESEIENSLFTLIELKSENKKQMKNANWFP